MSVRTMAKIWEHSKHCGTELLMLLAIADFADDEGRAYPSVAGLAAKCRMKPRNANYILANLQTSGELRVRVNAGPKGKNLYHIQLAGMSAAGLQAGAPLQSGAGAQGVAGMQRGAGLQPVAPTPAMECAKPLHPIAAEPSLNHQEPSARQTSANKRMLPCPFDAIREVYNASLPDEQVPWPPARATTTTKDRQKAMAARWAWVLSDLRDDGTRRATNEAEALAWFGRFFAKAWEDDHLAGRSARGPGHEKWRCSLDFLLTDRALLRVIE